MRVGVNHKGRSANHGVMSIAQTANAKKKKKKKKEKKKHTEKLAGKALVVECLVVGDVKQNEDLASG